VAERSWRRAAARDAIASRPNSRFSRDSRLRRKPEFDRVYRDGRRQASRHFIVFSAANGLERSRFGMSVGRALGGAVLRNRIRRRLREVLRRLQQEIPSGWDIILHPRASVASAKFQALAAEILSLLRSALTPAPPPSGEIPREVT
jgi:ribonuclease P protein component